MGTHIVTDNQAPSAAPPFVGLHLIVEGAGTPSEDGFWFSIGTGSTDDWLQAAHRPPYDTQEPGPGGISLTPEYVGQTFVDQTEEKMYYAVDTNDENDWREAGSGSGGGGTPVPMLARPENVKSVRRATWYAGKQQDNAVDYRYCGNPVDGVVGRDTLSDGDNVGFLYVAMWRHPSFNVNTIAISTDGGESWVPQIRENHSIPPGFPTKHDQGLNLDREFHMVGFGFNWAALSNDSYVTVVNPVEVHVYMDGWSSFLDRHYLVYNTRGTDIKFFLEAAAEADACNYSAFLFSPSGTRGRYVMMLPETAGLGDYFIYGTDGVAPGGVITRFVVAPGELRTDLDAGRVPVKDSLIMNQGGYTYFVTADAPEDPAVNPIKVWRIATGDWNFPIAGQVTPIKVWDSSTDSVYPGAPSIPWQKARKGMLIGGNDGSGGSGDRAYFTLYNRIYEIQTNQPVVDVTPTSPNFPVMGDYVLGYDPWAEKVFFIQNAAHATDFEGPSPEGGEFRDKDQVYGLGLLGVEYTSDPEEHGWMEPSTYADDVAAGVAAEGVGIAYGERMRWQQDAMGLIGHYGNADGSIQYYARVTTRRGANLGSVGITPHPRLKKFA